MALFAGPGQFGLPAAVDVRDFKRRKYGSAPVLGLLNVGLVCVHPLGAFGIRGRLYQRHSHSRCW